MKLSPYEILDAAARRHISDKINLYPQIAEKIERKAIWRSLRIKPALMVASILLAISMISGVAYAIGRSLGYIPGVGLVEESNGIYILDEPVSVSHAGHTVTVKQVVADSQRTYLAYKVDGILPVRSGFPICTDAPGLALPDGSMLNFTGGGGGGMESSRGQPMRFETSYTFAPLPAQARPTQTRKLIFISPCEMPMLELVLAAAPADYATPATVIWSNHEIDEPSLSGTTDSDSPLIPAKPTSVPNGSGLYLDQVIEIDNAYVLIGNFTDAGDLPGSVLISETSDSFYRPKIEDASGESIVFKVRQDIHHPTVWGGFYSWAYEIPKTVAGPVKITLDQVNIEFTDTFQFQFDTGSDPNPRQQWELNLPCKIGGYDYVIDQVKKLKNGYLLKWHSGVDMPEDSFFNLSIKDLTRSETAEHMSFVDKRQTDQINYTMNFLTDESVPTGVLTFELTLNQTVPLYGPWSITWIPPNP
ncbi:MAG: DUF4179 domain-containing protein [Chloroflexota bacterium]